MLFLNPSNLLERRETACCIGVKRALAPCDSAF